MVESYTEKMSDELIHLNKEDQVYVKKMVAYIGAKSYFYDDEALGEQLYNMVCDLKVAEKEGIRAVDYFGKDPRAMVDQVLADLPKRSFGSYVGLVFLLGVILVGMRYLMDFTWMTPLKIEPLTYVVILLNFLVFSQFITWLWSKQSYGEMKWPWATFISVISLMVFLNIVRLFSIYFGHIGSLFLSDGWAIVLAVLVLLGFAVMAYRSRNRLMSSLLVMGLTFLVTGCWIRLVNQETAHLIGWLLPLMGLVLTLIVFCLQRKKKEGRSMKSAMYFEETQALMKTFSQEDQVYFQDLWDYFNLAGFLYEEKALREQVYKLALDFSQAGADGLTAKDYFGLDPKGMADQIIENMPKESTRSVLKYGAIFSGIVIFYRLLSDFASQAVLVLKPLVYLTDIILGLLAVGIIFYLLRRLIFAEEKAKKAIYVAFVLVLGFYFVGEIVGVRFLPALAWFVVPSPWDALLMTGSSGALILWQWKEEFGRAFIFPIVAFLVVGFLHRWTLAKGVQNLGMTVLLPTVIIVFGLVIYYSFTIRALKKNRTESDK